MRFRIFAHIDLTSYRVSDLLGGMKASSHISNIDNDWLDLGNGVFRYIDSCIVYAIDTGSSMLVINAGSGEWIDAAGKLPAPIGAVVLTHFFRDHSSGGVRVATKGIEIRASHWEREQLADSDGLFARRETYIVYDNNWDLFSPVEPIPVNRWLHDYERFDYGDAKIDVLPAPGASLGAIAIGVHIRGLRLLFAGEAIHSSGKILRIAPLQYNYNDLPGAVNLLYTLGVMKAWEPDTIFSSTSRSPIRNPSSAMTELAANLKTALAGRPETMMAVQSATTDAIDEITPHLYKSRHSSASSYFLVSASGKVLAIDYGYREMICFGGSYPYPRNRRPLLHGLQALTSDLGVDGIDAVLVTHFHDDHINGIPMLQRLYKTRCYAGENFAAILADPTRFAFPCTWPEPISVEPLSLEVPFQWEEYEIRLHPMSGHTRFSTLVETVVDGMKIVATGDQYFFQDFEKPGRSASMHNHVYRNGASLDSFEQSTAVIREIRPDIILPGHGEAYRVPDELYSHIGRYTEDYRRIHTDLMPLGEDDVHFDVDSRAAWIEPYRTILDRAEAFTIHVHVRNPYPEQSILRVIPVVPEGWSASEGQIELDPRAEGDVSMSIVPAPDFRCRRRPISIELRGPDRTFGQVAEALVTIGHPVF